MELLKLIFPFSFLNKPDMATLLLHVLAYLVAGIVVSYVLSLLTGIPLLGVIFGLARSLLDLYALAGVILTCLDYFQLLK